MTDPFDACRVAYEQGQRDGYEQAKRVYMAAGEAGVALAASDALTASGCIGHALPGRPGADYPCSEFEGDSDD